MNSALYSGTVTHSRLEPFSHRFRYRIFYGFFDLDEFDSLDAELRLFSFGRRNLFSVHPEDYGPADGSSLRRWAQSRFEEAGIDVTDGRIYLLTLPRVLGYVFNPLSIWYGYDADGNLRGIIHEVRNTFGDRHSYVARVEGDLDHGFDKQMHVSPFNGMDQRYRFSLSEPGESLSVSIDTSGDGETLVRAGMALRRLPLTDANLWRLLWSHPLLTFKVITAIHWQALRLWLRGATFHSRPEPPSHSITIVKARSSVV